MNDSISRQEAIDAVKTYLTDCQVEDADWHGCGIEHELNNLPSAQPEVVRCKDCKYWDHTECIGGDCFCEKMFERNMGDGDFDFFTKENWYCAEGEKK